MCFLSQLLPYLTSESVTGINNASYHFDMFNKPLGSNSRKYDILVIARPSSNVIPHSASQIHMKLLILVKMRKPQNKIMNSIPLQSEPQGDVIISVLPPVNVNAFLRTQRRMWLPETIHLRLQTSNSYLM
jgi:hypothetical protein